MTIRTFIWGSCVSRDTFEFLPDEYELVGYVARQSWLSADHPARNVSIGEFPSDFQRRMTEGDVVGNAMQRIRENADELDLLLLDLCDERLGVVDLGEDGVITRSVEKLQTGVQEAIDSAGSFLPLGDSEHAARWSEAAEAIARELRELGLIQNTVVLAPEWAMVDDQAQPTPTSFGMTAPEMNAQYSSYYERLSRRGLRVLQTGPTVAGSQHRWGRAAFHYHDSVYEHLVLAIRALHR